MEVLDSRDARPRRRVRWSAPLVVAALLLTLAAAQAAALLWPRGLPADAAVEALPNGFSYATDGDTAVVGFQLRNSGGRDLRVLSIAADVPGLELVDVTASGEPFRFETVGAGTVVLPAFDLPATTVIEVNLRYLVRRCGEVPADDLPLLIAARAELGEGLLAVPLPGLPSEAVDAAPDDEDPWQRVLVRDLCP